MKVDKFNSLKRLVERLSLTWTEEEANECTMEKIASENHPLVGARALAQFPRY